MKRPVFTVERPPFLTIGLFFLGLAFRYFEDLRKALPKSEEFDHAFAFFTIFLVIGTLSLGLYIGFMVSENNIARNMEKSKEDSTNQPPPQA